MLGAIVGDIVGSVFEGNDKNCESFDPLFQPYTRFTDDSVLTLATADKLMYGGNYCDIYQIYGRRFPDAGYGGSFNQWIYKEQPEPYNSWGNGSAMRASPIGWVADSIETAIEQAKHSAEVTHSHPEGIKGAQAIAVSVFMARHGFDKSDIKKEVEKRFEYNLDRTVESIRPKYFFDVSCQGSVPEAIIAFIDSTDFESAIRLAISLGGDSDTLACMSGSIAHAFYGPIPEAIVTEARERLAPTLLPVLDEFCEKFAVA